VLPTRLLSALTTPETPAVPLPHVTDPASAETIRLLLRAISERGITIVMTSHILTLVDRISDRVMLIRHGSLVWNSPTSELPDSAEKLYFDLVETPAFRDMEWLHSQQS
jgi:ABC-2 type transport system ATP-binding protein